MGLRSPHGTGERLSHGSRSPAEGAARWSRDRHCQPGSRNCAGWGCLPVFVDISSVATSRPNTLWHNESRPCGPGFTGAGDRDRTGMASLEGLNTDYPLVPCRAPDLRICDVILSDRTRSCPWISVSTDTIGTPRARFRWGRRPSEPRCCVRRVSSLFAAVAAPSSGTCLNRLRSVPGVAGRDFGGHRHASVKAAICRLRARGRVG